jgi:2-isopropylmalate synthase
LESEYSTGEKAVAARVFRDTGAGAARAAVGNLAGERAEFAGYVRILDTTLRDGEQTPGISLTPEQKLRLAGILDGLGVDTIEAGFPVTSKGEEEAVKRIASSETSAKVICLARAEKRDIEKAVDCGISSIHIFLASSDIHLADKLKMNRGEMLRKAADAVDFAGSHGLEVEFSAEDSTRTEPSFLLEVARTVHDAGAATFDIADTVGVATPELMDRLVRTVSGSGMEVSVHCHNDFGLAVANSIAAVKAGAAQVHATLNGIGERAGNTSLEEFAAAAQWLYGYRTGIIFERISSACEQAARITGVPIHSNKPIVGRNAFGHKSGIHTHGILENPRTYEPFDPRLVGRGRWMQAGKHSGHHGIEAQLKEQNIMLAVEELDMVVRMVKQRGDCGMITAADELARMAERARKSSLQQVPETGNGD